ncbi:hypothetical protein Bbelb_377070 [Branchiostoma belcheri]|nr:hypothetical protein Bbelb_377070 [Branchiostoma belcheri]
MCRHQSCPRLTVSFTASGGTTSAFGISKQNTTRSIPEAESDIAGLCSLDLLVYCEGDLVLDRVVRSSYSLRGDLKRYRVLVAERDRLREVLTTRPRIKYQVSSPGTTVAGGSISCPCATFPVGGIALVLGRASSGTEPVAEVPFGSPPAVPEGAPTVKSCLLAVALGTPYVSEIVTDNTGYSVSPEVPARPHVGSPKCQREIRSAGVLGPRRCTRLRRNAFESFYGTFGSPGRTRKEPPGRTASSMEAREVGIRNPYRTRYRGPSQSYTVGATWQTQYQAYTLTRDVPKLGTHLHLSKAASATFFLKTWGRSGVDARHSHGFARCKSVVCTPRLAVGGCVHRFRTEAVLTTHGCPTFNHAEARTAGCDRSILS